MNFSFSTGIIQKVLDLHKTEFIKLSYIFASEKVQFYNSKFEKINTGVEGTIKSLFLHKVIKEYPDGKYLDLKIFADRIEGEVLFNSGGKKVISTKI